MNLRQLYLKTVNKSIAFFGGRKNSDRFMRFHGRSGTSFFRAVGFASLKKAKSFNSAFY
jgi:hypothetical protein